MTIGAVTYNTDKPDNFLCKRFLTYCSGTQERRYVVFLRKHINGKITVLNHLCSACERTPEINKALNEYSED